MKPPTFTFILISALILALLATALLFAPSVSRGAAWGFGLLRLIPKRFLWEAVSVVFCLQGVWLVVRWLKESRGRRPFRLRSSPGGGALEALRRELENAGSSPYFRERILMRLRALAIEVVSLQEEASEKDARVLLEQSEWARTAGLHGLSEHNWRQGGPIGYGKDRGKRLLRKIDDYLERISNVPGTLEISENGTPNGN